MDQWDFNKFLLVASFSPNLMYFLSLGSKIYELHYEISEIGDFSIFPTLMGFYHGSFYYLKERILTKSIFIFPFMNLASLIVNLFFSSIYFYYYARKSILFFFLYLLILLVIEAVMIVVSIELHQNFQKLYDGLGVALNCLYFIQDFKIWKYFSKSTQH